LSWNASTSQVAGYNIYRGSQPSGPFTKLNSTLDTGTAYTDTSVFSGQTYYYAATSVDSNNVESAYSNIATALIP
jgi:fibronectin type 3 domain-containing protein